MATLNDVVAKYVSLRDEAGEIAKRHAAELAPYSEKMDTIEQWLLKEMDRMGVDSLKTPSGTPYKAVSKSVKMADGEAFRQFVFAPVVDAMKHVPGAPDMLALLQGGVRWDCVDFRCGKKGILEHIESTGEVPAGVSIDSFTKVNIRRS